MLTAIAVAVWLSSAPDQRGAGAPETLFAVRAFSVPEGGAVSAVSVADVISPKSDE